jgi:hypothetical protein
VKLKTDFVTNSSSTAFIVSLPEEMLAEFYGFVNILDKNPDYDDEGVSIFSQLDSVRELYEYTTNKPYDWISKAMAPKFVNMTKEYFEKCLKCIKKGNTVLLVDVNYNASEEFETSKYQKYIVDEMEY